MRILHLSLTNFRNYSHLELDLPSGIVLLQGDNAQGKTNLLEAIYYLSRTRSPRTSTDRELINWLALEEDLPFARLVAQVQTGNEATQVELALIQGNPQKGDADSQALRKHIRVNGAARRAMDAVGLLSAVLFLPEDIELVAGSPHMRRRYLDDTIGQITPRYRAELARYEQVLAQRNHLLKSLRGQGNASEQLLFWDQRLVEHGAYIIVQRQRTVAQLDQFIERIHPRLTGDAERLRLEYCASLDLERRPAATYQMALPARGGLPAATNEEERVQNVAATFAEQLRGQRARDLQQGMSTLGPHRDDVGLVVNGVNMTTYGSRGQQRTIALSLKLAEVELITQEKADSPVLLLDDVMSELDESRRSFLAQAMDGAQQVIVTTNDAHRVDQPLLARASQWRVCAGRLERLTPPSTGGAS